MGATCSPLADTSIVSATSGELSIIDHIKTQAPYSIVCGVIALVGYLVSSFTENLIFGYGAVAALFVISVIIMKKVSLKEAVLPFAADTERSNQQLSVE